MSDLLSTSPAESSVQTPALRKHPGTLSDLLLAAQSAFRPGLWVKAKPTFQKEIAATQSAGVAIFDMLAVL